MRPNVTVNEQAIDVGEVSKQNYIGRQPEAALPVALKCSAEWASWVLSLSEVWQDDAPMQDRPLEVHCSGLGGGLLSGEHDYDIFLQNLAQTKVYGPSLAMTDSPGGGCCPPRGMSVRAGGGPVRVRGDVKLWYSAGELLKAPVPNEP